MVLIILVHWPPFLTIHSGAEPYYDSPFLKVLWIFFRAILYVLLFFFLTGHCVLCSDWL